MTYLFDEINRKVRDMPQAFVDECDAEAQRRIEIAAERIIANLPQSPIVLLAGPSGSGKTTTAKKLEIELEKRGINTHSVSMDNYFVTLDPDTAPRTAKGDIDYESPKCLDMELLNEHFAKLSVGEEIRIPHFMFDRQKRSASRFTNMRLRKNEIAIFEGIHAFNDAITDAHPEAFNLYISVNTRIQRDGDKAYFRRKWMRLLRRVVRDDKFRGSDAEFTLKMWSNVVDGEVKNILSNIDKTDYAIDSSLAYEVSLMAPFALPLFEALPQDQTWVPQLPLIIERLREFEPLDEKYVRQESLMREFIGGGIYKY